MWDHSNGYSGSRSYLEQAQHHSQNILSSEVNYHILHTTVICVRSMLGYYFIAVMTKISIQT